jgi:hypothetical protein
MAEAKKKIGAILRISAHPASSKFCICNLRVDFPSGMSSPPVTAESSSSVVRVGHLDF